MVLQSIKSVFALVTVIGVGYYFTGKSWFRKAGMDFLSKFTIQATIPIYMFYNIYTDIGSKEALFALISRLPIAFGLILACIALVAILSVIVRISPRRRFTLVAAASFPNVVFIGFPVIQALWGNEITSIGVIYYISNTVLFWTIGIWLLQKDGKAESIKNNTVFSNLKMLISPSIVAMMLAMLFLILEIQIPDFILTPLSMITGLTSTLALIFIGSVIRNMDINTIQFGRDIYLALFLRFIMIPIAAALFLRMMPISIEIKQVFFILTTMPSMTQMGIMTKEYEGDYEFSCTIVMMTTIISMLTIPMFMFIMQTFQIF